MLDNYFRDLLIVPPNHWCWLRRDTALAIEDNPNLIYGSLMYPSQDSKEIRIFRDI